MSRQDYDPDALEAEAKRLHAEASARFDEVFERAKALRERAKPPMVIPVISKEYWHSEVENEPLELGDTTLSAAYGLQAMGDYDLGIAHGVYVGGAFIPWDELRKQYKDELRAYCETESEGAC